MINLAGNANEVETSNDLLFNLNIRGQLIAGFAALSLVFAGAAQALNNRLLLSPLASN